MKRREFLAALGGATHLLRRLRVRDQAGGIGPAQLSALLFSCSVVLGRRANWPKPNRCAPPTMRRIVQGLERSGLVCR